ncbi:MAG: DnaA/Hda family protein [Bacteroidetes bacterium]|nr:DnaA/Hda family protein [Bacteroidota bacterium]
MSNFIQSDGFQRYMLAMQNRLASETGIKSVEAAEAERGLKLASALAASGIPKRFSSISMAGDEKEQEFNALMESVVKSKRGVFLYGKQGVGKSVMMAQMLKALAEKSPSVKYITAIDLVMEIQSRYSKTGESALDYIKKVRTVYALGIDDFSNECIQWTNDRKELMFALIDYREQNGLLTFMTSNKTTSMIEKLIGRSLASRLYGMMDEVELVGSDRRIQAGEKDNDNR